MIPQRRLLALLVLLMWSGVSAQQCTDAIPEDVLLEAQLLPANGTIAYPEAEIRNLLANESQDVQASIKAAQAETADTLGEVFSLADYYYDVCPTYRFVWPFKWWYFFYNNRQLKCFPLYPIYFVSCRTRYCRLSNINIYYWWYRCIPEWRYQYFWAVCADQQGFWTVRYVKWSVSVCCNCKRYYKYAPDTCQITTQSAIP